MKRNFGGGVEHFIRGVRETLGGGVKPLNHPVNPPVVAIPHVDIMCEIDFTYENFTREVFPFHIWISHARSYVKLHKAIFFNLNIQLSFLDLKEEQFRTDGFTVKKPDLRGV